MRDYLLRKAGDDPDRRGPGIQTVSLSHIRFGRSIAGRDEGLQREENDSTGDVDDSSKVRYLISVHTPESPVTDLII